MKIIDCEIQGLRILETYEHRDSRGAFVKIFNKELFQSFDLESDFQENYYSISKVDVIRGMHFQTPPYDHAKLVHVISGSILDVVLDIRKNSSTYGKFFSIVLSDKNRKSIYIPKGFAHGFCSLEENSCVNYLQTVGYHPENDHGILYSSFGFSWKIENPIVSPRDLSFPAFSDFISPFELDDA